ncbi:Outer dense fiber protein 3 [Papilio machaon]|uniref:Outer dense fiber protein 3 n=1 Tax=Papilio machaon TaxID=76193 RepID=A0A0N1PHV3_PAPMA|nr:Outer dense fiber protein 3 [Papilio machaon]
MTCKRPLGPGPGAYALPPCVGFQQHDPTRYRNPMFSLAGTSGFRMRPVGPGPAYRIDRVTRDGVVSTPAWTFGSRIPGRSLLRTPGPGAHAPERCPRGVQAPIYSMGARPQDRMKKVGPAPNTYNTRYGFGGPAYTMGARLGVMPPLLSPGPAVYYQKDADIYKTRHPCYSLGARLGGAGKATRTPGPAAYPPNLYNTKKNPYSYSFGTKHNEYACPMIIKEDTMDCL